MPHRAIEQVDDDHIDPEVGWAAHKARAWSAVAAVGGLTFGMIGGAGRTYEVVGELSYGAPFAKAILALGVRPLSLPLYGFIIAVQLAFLAWQIVAYRLRAAVLFVPGLLAAAMIVGQMLFTSWLHSWATCACNPVQWSGWYDLLIIVGMLVLNNWILGTLGAVLVRPPPTPWLRARLAGFACTNGGLLMLSAQIAFLDWRFGSAAFR